MAQLDADTNELLTQCEAGQPGARDRLFHRHRDRLRRMVRAHLDERLRGRLDPSDVVQEALAEATMRLPDFLARRPIAFYPWLRQIAWEKLVHLHEKHIFAQKRSVDREARWRPRLNDESISGLAAQLTGPTSTPSAHVLRHEVHERVRQAMDRLSPEDRSLVILRYVEQLSFREVADALGSTEGAVKTRHFRIVQRLHSLLEPDAERPIR